MNLIVFALAPVLAIVIYIYLKDKYDREPKRLLIYNFILGAFVSIIITSILYIVLDAVFPLTNKRSIVKQFIRAFFIVGLVEEFSKYIVVRYYAQPKKEFSEPFDGIMYSVMVSMGFAATENIFYVLDGGLTTAVLRAFTAIPAHATFGILMGYFMGKAKFAKNRAQLNLAGLFLAVLFHGAYDFFLFIDFVPGISSGAFVSLFIGLYLSRKAIKKHRNKSAS
jgi:RsiW-degrading membrane proteinase PrsW (M82 family)